MKALKVLIIFPLMLLGHLCGFVFQALWVGFFSGQASVNECGDACYADLKAKKK